MDSLHSIIITTIGITAIFVIFLGFIPGESYVSFKDYEQTYIRDETVKGSDFNIYNQTDNFNMSSSYDWTLKTYNGLDVRFYYYNAPGWFVFRVRHVEWVIPWTSIEILYHPLRFQDGSEYITVNKLIDGYDNETDTSTIKISCPHIDMRLTIASNDSTKTFFEAINEHSSLSLQLNYQIDFSSMAGNIWIILGNLLTFQTIQTGQPFLDIFLNGVVGIPLYISFGYILYKLIAGLIPFVSGGG